MTEFVQAGDVRVAFERVGSGPPLVLMHGAEASRQMFASLMPSLAPHFTVIAYDQRDCGDTEAPERARSVRLQQPQRRRSVLQPWRTHLRFQAL